ncbi:MAG: hypothetical protein HC900_03185 [Methylacidiphilales bacterium]|nr:hypothetical protein [Candidatus Methylacidiphilales bacterium]
MVWRPIYLAHSAWVEHIPFAFWLVEAHRPSVLVELGSHWGVSYFAFCQAVERLGLDTRCYAVDTWQGDDHAGLYGEEVYKQVRAHNEALYSGFSRLVRSRFDEALAHFSDGTIDLLHIDGLHTFDAVAHDFETWRPKLSTRAVVVFHDTNVRERGFGVYKLFERLRSEYPTFEFVHGHGLGAVGVGVEQTARLAKLFAADAKPIERRGLREVFGRLGQACADAQQRRLVENQAATLRQDLAAARKQLEETEEALGKALADLDERTKELDDERVHANMSSARQ